MNARLSVIAFATWASIGPLAVSVARAAEPPSAQSQDLIGEINALNARVAQLESQQNDTWLTQQRAAQIRGIVEKALQDARTRGQFADGSQVGYAPATGFFLQTPDQSFKLNISGYVQVRYDFEQVNATNGRTLGVAGSTTAPHDPANSNGFGVRKARLGFAGNVISPNLTYKLEGDFYSGGSGGAFTVTDAYAAYAFNDALHVKAGAYKVPFAKAELTADALVTTQERAEVLQPFDPVRALGVSLYGDLIKDQLAYEAAINNGGNSNTLRRPDTAGASANFDNRLAFYARVQWAGNARQGADGKLSGGLSDFAEEADLRVDNRRFIWMVGGAVGYESQNASTNAFPSPQGSTSIGGLSNGIGPGFSTYTLNGDLFRATLDWSAKYQGLSLLTAAYFQQINANPGSTSANTITTSPFGAANASFFEHAYYGQVGYFVIPRKLELIARAGALLTEGYPNVGEFYTAGANYYLCGQNLKIQADVTYTPEAPFSDSASGTVQNTHDLMARLQVQIKF